MTDRNLLRGLFLAAIAAAFGLGAIRFPVGTMANPGPGLFPLLISGLLMALALGLVVQSRVLPPVPFQFSVRNTGLILLGLVSFVLLSEWVSTIAGIVAMVFAASLAGSSFSFWRSLKIAAGLVALAAIFQSLLGLDLEMY